MEELIDAFVTAYNALRVAAFQAEQELTPETLAALGTSTDAALAALDAIPEGNPHVDALRPAVDEFAATISLAVAAGVDGRRTERNVNRSTIRIEILARSVGRIGGGYQSVSELMREARQDAVAASRPRR